MADETNKHTESVKETETRWAKEIAAAGAQTEKEMRESKVPTPNTPEELLAYIGTLTDRPHDYGTCVYAMSHAAVAAFNYVAHKLQVTGFQASCADMDILRHTRRFEWGRICNYSDLLYPQYLTEEKFPSIGTLLNNDEVRTELKKRAAAKLTDATNAHPEVRAWWEFLAAYRVPHPVTEKAETDNQTTN